MSQAFIPIRFDKSHLSSIGSRLYTQSLDLVRELVANSYDADATEVHIAISGNDLTVVDNGIGMDRNGLEQYFTIGSPFKRDNPKSPRYGRVRIGEFGIGKFAVLSLCDRFELQTKTENYSATVIFDRADFESREDWSVPIVEHAVDASKKTTGSRVTLFSLKRELLVSDIERHLVALFPLSDNKFSIFIDGKKLTPHYIAGRRFPIKESTPNGSVKGEVILASLAIPKDLIGIGIFVKNVLIRRETFGIELKSLTAVRRLTGAVYADFLPVTTARSNFIKDSDAYKQFYALMQKRLKRVIREIEKSALSYADTKSERLLNDVLTHIQRSLKKNGDIFITADLPLFTSKKTTLFNQEKIGDSIIGQAMARGARAKTAVPAASSASSIMREALKNLKPKVRRPVKTVLKDQHRIVKKVKLGGAELLVSFAHLGSEEKESFSEGGIIFINRDHPLFTKINKRSDLLYYHMVRLICQELIKFTSAKSIDVAFDWHGRLITDAFAKIGKGEADSAGKSETAA